jgi:hypothetical protein
MIIKTLGRSRIKIKRFGEIREKNNKNSGS